MSVGDTGSSEAGHDDKGEEGHEGVMGAVSEGDSDQCDPAPR